VPYIFIPYAKLRKTKEEYQAQVETLIQVMKMNAKSSVADPVPHLDPDP
jgi:hypothetical protein